VNSASATDISLGDFSFKVSSVISISPSQGNIGSSVNITGSGFAPNSSLTFLYDDAELSVNVTTSDTGTFTKSITISKSTGGIHTISVIDSQNNRASATFTMESIAPAIPEPVSPEDGTKMGFFGGAVPSFQWEKVSDPSGVTYSLQVDTSDDFSDPIINKTGLENNKYTVNNNDALPRGEYYWRVKAVDAAGNESEWSSPMLLVSGSMNPAVFIIIIIAVIAALAAAFYFLLLPRIRKSKVKQPAAGAASPEIVIPEVVNAEYRMLETEKKSLPWKLALPQAPQAAKGPKSLSSEDQARLKAIIEFAKSLPLVEPGANTQWLIELAESGGSQNTTPIQSQLLKGEAQVHYEPAWMRHPTYMDLQSLLEGQPILQDLNSYVDSINHSAMDAAMILQDIYRDSTSELGQDIFVENGWDYISAVYSDAFGWFQGKNLREPSERDYSIKAEPLSNGASTFTLSGESNSPFPGKLIQVTDEKQAVQLRALHLKLRRTYRSNERTRSLVSMIMQLEVQRGRLINAFNQFNRLNPA